MISRLFASRGRFLRAATGTFAVVGMIRGRASAAQWDLKMSVNVPVEHPTYVRGTQTWDAVRRETGGRLDVKTFPNSILGAQDKIIGELRLGAVAFVNNSNTAFTGLIPVTEIELLPFIFASNQQAWHVLDGPLGRYVSDQFVSRGLKVIPPHYDLGMRELAVGPHPVRNVGDLAGLKLIVPLGNLYIDFWKSLGASPIPIAPNQWYTSLQTHIADSVDSGLVTTETYHFYEVQKYVSLTHHMWAGGRLVCNLDVWNAFPPDVQAIVERNHAKFAALERKDIVAQTLSLSDKLQRRGMAVNTTDTSGMKAMLSAFYAQYKPRFGNTLWSMLEEGIGRKLS